MLKRLDTFSQGGIARLPDEILSLVFELSCEAQGTRTSSSSWPRQVKNVCLVSRRFRDVALRTPLLWTRLRNYNRRLDWTGEWGTAIIARSGDCNLNVHARPATKVFIDRAITACSRWRDCSIGFLSEDGVRARDACVGLHLPRLETLVIDVDDAHVYTTWIAPKLTDVTFVNDVPKPFASSQHLSNVTLDLNSIRVTASWMVQLLRFLASLPSIKQFTFSLYGVVNEWEEATASPVTAELTTLDSLTIDYISIDKDDDIEFLNPFISALQLPKLTRLSIRLAGVESPPGNNAGTDFDISTVNDILWNLMRHPNISDLDICIRDVLSSSTHTTLTLPLHSILHLRCAVISTDLEVDPTSIRFDEGDPTFRSLELVDCPEIDAHWFEVLVKNLQRGNWQGVEKVKVSGCDSEELRHDTLAKLVPLGILHCDVPNA